MDTQINRWGNSLAVRIPRAYARKTGLDVGTPIVLSVQGGRLIITPRTPHYELQELLDGVDEENLPVEVDWGPPVGREIW